jgi:flagellar biogenesis protein FliO
MGETATGMNGFITAIQTTLTTDTMWGELAKAGAFIGTIAVFVFGVYIVRRLVKGAAKGKLKI